MNVYEELKDPVERAEARDLARLAADIVNWAGQSNMTIAQALPEAWDFCGQSAAFIKAKNPPIAKQRKRA